MEGRFVAVGRRVCVVVDVESSNGTKVPRSYKRCRIQLTMF